MSTSANTRVNTGKQITTDFELSKIFILNNRYDSSNYVNNSAYNPITLRAGTVMGRITATGVLVPFRAIALDGSQLPIGILADDLVNLPAGSTVQATICIAGDINAYELIFWEGTDITLNTIVQGRRIIDRLQADSAGLIIRQSTQMTDFDN